MNSIYKWVVGPENESSNSSNQDGEMASGSRGLFIVWLRCQRRLPDSIESYEVKQEAIQG